MKFITPRTLFFLAAMLLASGCSSKSKEMVELFFNESSHVEIAEAICVDDIDRLQNLIQAGFDINETGIGGMDFLTFSLLADKKRSFEILLNYGARIDNLITDYNGQRYPTTVGEFAALSEDPSWLTLLLDKGLDPNTGIGAGHRNLLYSAIINDRLTNVKKLVEAGADINRKNAVGLTPVRFAAGLWRYDIVAFLISEGADLTPKTKNGKDFFDDYNDYKKRVYGSNPADHKFDLATRELEKLNLKP